LGEQIHHKFDPNRTKRPIRNIFHMVVGLTLTVLGFVQVFKGMRLYGSAWQRNAPGYIWALYDVSLILLGDGLPYILFSAHRWLRFAHSVDFNRSGGTDSKDGRLL
jgi:hypothetical protein